MRKGVKIFRNYLAKHIKFLQGSLKRRKSGQIFPNFSCRTQIKLLGVKTINAKREA